MASVAQRGTFNPFLAAIRAAVAASGVTQYAPKFCRTRNCSLPYLHDGAHDGAATPLPGPARRPRVKPARRSAARSQRSAQWHAAAAHRLARSNARRAS